MLTELFRTGLGRLLRVVSLRKRQGYAIFPLGRLFEETRTELQLDRAALANILRIDVGILKRLEWGEVPEGTIVQRIVPVFENATAGRAYLCMIGGCDFESKGPASTSPSHGSGISGGPASSRGSHPTLPNPNHVSR
jgi:hypothetical protein